MSLLPLGSYERHVKDFLEDLLPDLLLPGDDLTKAVAWCMVHASNQSNPATDQPGIVARDAIYAWQTMMLETEATR